MGDHPRSPTLDLHNIFKIPKTKSLKDMGKVYKSLVTKRHKDKIPEEPITPTTFEHNDNKRVDEDIWSPKFLSRTASRRSKTPTPSKRSPSRHARRRCTTPTPTSLSRSASRKTAAEIATSSLKRIMSRRGSSLQSENSSTAPSLSRNMSRWGSSESETPNNPEVSPPSKDVCKRSSGETEIPSVSLSSNLSRRATTPIIFSQTTVRRKPPEVEKKIKCSLEDLCFGCIKKIKVTRDVIKHPGVILQQEEILKIEVKPGWRKGTKIIFEGKGDEKPGYLPADIVFSIDEKKHPWFSRDGNDLEVCIEIPLVEALTGCSITIPLLGGENMTLSFENTVIYPGYEKVIQGQGMPTSKNDGTRGDLHVKFLIDFPTELSDEQRQEAASILQDCC